VPSDTVTAQLPGEGPLQQHPSLASAAEDWITGQILRGQIKPGEKLAEVALAQQMGISRSPVREALRALSAQGLIVVEPRRGAFVAELDAQHGTDLYVCRLLIEPECVRQAVEALSDNALATLQEIFARMQEAADQSRVDAYVGALTDYNQELLEACPNRILFGHAESTWRSSLRYWGLMVRNSDTYCQQSLRRNRNVHRAVCKRDGDKAAEAVTTLLEWSRNELLSVVSQLPPASEQPAGPPSEN
jgi:DNA-binding GntR family transcriptional regulator